MNVIKLFIVLFLITYNCFSQTKKEDIYFILRKKDSNYVVSAKGVEISDLKNPYKIQSFNIYNKFEYEKRKKKIAEEKKKGTYYSTNYWGVPDKTIVFKVIGNETPVITHCDTHFLNSVDYKWIKDNTWKENNPNILFENLYFILKTERDKYLKYKVERIAVEY